MVDVDAVPADAALLLVVIKFGATADVTELFTVDNNGGKPEFGIDSILVELPNAPKYAFSMARGSKFLKSKFSKLTEFGIPNGCIPNGGISDGNWLLAELKAAAAAAAAGLPIKLVDDEVVVTVGVAVVEVEDS